MRIPVAMMVVLGLSGPVLSTLALERGRLYGERGHGRLVSSLLIEPAGRLTVGVALALAAGAVGGAVGVTLAGYGALEMARRGRQRRAMESDAPGGHAPADAAAGTVLWTMAGFVLAVVVQNQDLLIANRVLTPGAAGQFAVVSTIGGIAAFATLTTPLVLLPRASRGRPAPLSAALGVTALVGAAAVLVSALSPTALVVHLFGTRYAGVAPLVAPYVFAMALLGVARVLVAHGCTTRGTRSRVAAVALVASAALAQAALILRFGHDPRAVAFSTVAATAGLTTSLGVLELVRLPAARRLWAPWTAVRSRPASSGPWPGPPRREPACASSSPGDCGSTRPPACSRPAWAFTPCSPTSAPPMSTPRCTSPSCGARSGSSARASWPCDCRPSWPGRS